MDIQEFTSNRTGQLVRADEGYWAFVPDPLPPRLDLGLSLFRLTSDADAELGKLNGLVSQMSDPGALFHNFLRQEAVLSSKIEGTRTTVEGLALFEATKSRDASRDELEVSNYVEALKLGMMRCKEIPLGTTFLSELHSRLFHGAKKPKVTPGSFRKEQVLVGSTDGSYRTARFVPPPAHHIAPLMENLETFLRDNTLPVLVRAAIAHYQFEAIHPYFDGNGRVGRLMISMMLGAEGRLSAPVLYLSAYFERHKLQYYDMLLNVSRTSSWVEWCEFFVRGVREQARDAAIRADRLNKLREEYKQRFSGPRTSGTMGRLIDDLFNVPATSVASAARVMNVGYKPARESIRKLEAGGVLRSVGKIGNAVYWVAGGIIAVSNLPLDALETQAARTN